ncbi:hypothetical protein KAK06_23440 [Ideonella sp. 4Y11]|uniref:Uncharacterized protein n=1 Tax=Ideonella aquatica TaxID=2824119 RepID=A0A940YPX0_9BURK|nr:hypothetical protein [Ideonella aquatica]MBQ0961911.1 hypothetical protein [Ideonella aquatica]
MAVLATASRPWSKFNRHGWSKFGRRQHKLQRDCAVTLPLLRKGAPVSSIAKTWAAELAKAQSVHRASQLYAGRTFRDAQRASQLLGAMLYVASAGLGLVGEDQYVPAYDLTVATSGATIHPQLDAVSASTADWWAALTSALGQPNSLATLATVNRLAIVYVAMPGTYLSMLADELASLPDDVLTRLRIFTSPSWAATAPARLAKQVLPYDDRLETTRFTGTRNDFAQRALLHFLEELNAHRLPMHEAKLAVHASMSKHARRSLPTRAKSTDEDIIELMRREWSAYGGASSRLLRFLRDEALVQCEQARFQGLWRRLHNAMKNPGGSTSVGSG